MRDGKITMQTSWLCESVWNRHCESVWNRHSPFPLSVLLSKSCRKSSQQTFHFLASQEEGKLDIFWTKQGNGWSWTSGWSVCSSLSPLAGVGVHCYTSGWSTCSSLSPPAGVCSLLSSVFIAITSSWSVCSSLSSLAGVCVQHYHL